MPTSMRRSFRSFTALSAVFIVCVGVAACGGIPGNAVVQVNGKSITKATFNHWMKIVTASSSGTASAAKDVVVPEPPSYTACIANLEKEEKSTKGEAKKSKAELKTECETQYTELQRDSLAYLISSEWVLGQAEEMKITATDKEVEKKLNTIKKEEFTTNAKFKEFLDNYHYTVSDLLLRVKVEDVLSPKIEEKVTKEAKKTPSKAEIAKYYNEHKSTYGEPEKRDLNIILTKKESEAKSAKSEIEGGTSFATVAKKVSIETESKSKGGKLEGVEKGEEEKALSEAVFSAKTNVLTGPVKTPFGYYVFEVTKVTKSSQKSLKSVESEISSSLKSKREDDALDKFEKEFKKRWTARTECRSGYVVEDCKNYKKTTTTSTSATSSATTSSTASSSTTTSSTSSSSSKK